MDNEAKRIAEGLTEAQRKALMRAKELDGIGWVVMRYVETEGGGLRTVVRNDVIWRLVDKGLLGRRPCQPLRKLGLRVRTYLEQKQ